MWGLIEPVSCQIVSNCLDSPKLVSPRQTFDIGGSHRRASDCPRNRGVRHYSRVRDSVRYRDSHAKKRGLQPFPASPGSRRDTRCETERDGADLGIWE